MFLLLDLALFQSTPSAWRETFGHGVHENARSISIHSLRMEGDKNTTNICNVTRAFQSTPSAWRETYANRFPVAIYTYFNPLPPHGGRLELSSCYVHKLHISIHSLRMEGDDDTTLRNVDETTFQSTPSAWRETAGKYVALDIVLFQSTPSAWRETFFVFVL